MPVHLAELLNPFRERVENGGFEDGTTFGPPVTDLWPPSSQLAAWTAVGNPKDSVAVAWCTTGNAADGEPAEGGRFVNLASFNVPPPELLSPKTWQDGLYAGVTQTIDTIPGATHRLRFALGTVFTAPQYQGPVAIRVFVTKAVDPAQLPGALATPALPVEVDEIFFNATNVDESASDKNVWERYSYDFTPSSSKSQLTIYGWAGADRKDLPPANYIGLDAVSLRVSAGLLGLVVAFFRSRFATPAGTFTRKP